MIIKFKDITSKNKSETGGKGYNLGILFNSGFNVPDGFVITANSVINKSAEEEILHTFDMLFPQADVLPQVAVRSSSVLEDQQNFSAAGQYQSFIYVERNKLIQKIKECQNSYNNPTVKAYLGTDNPPHIAVVVQKMIKAEIFGVTFTENPLNNSAQELVVEAIFGDGELLVSGEKTPANYVLNKQNLNIIAEVNPEYEAHKGAHMRETVKSAAPEFIKIQVLFGRPMDIEWAYANKTLYILQARPVTTIV